jgi:hypothetical protein
MADEASLEQTAAPAAEPPKPVITRISGGPPRSKTIALTWPVRHGDMQVTEIVLTRVTAGELSDYFASLRDGVKAVLPTLRLSNGEIAPVEVLAALDADDDAMIGREAESFLPLSLRRDNPSELPMLITSPAMSPANSDSA